MRRVFFQGSCNCCCLTLPVVEHANWPGIYQFDADGAILCQVPKHDHLQGLMAGKHAIAQSGQTWLTLATWPQVWGVARWWLHHHFLTGNGLSLVLTTERSELMHILVTSVNVSQLETQFPLKGVLGVKGVLGPRADPIHPEDLFQGKFCLESLHSMDVLHVCMTPGVLLAEAASWHCMVSADSDTRQSDPCALQVSLQLALASSYWHWPGHADSWELTPQLLRWMFWSPCNWKVITQKLRLG